MLTIRGRQVAVLETSLQRRYARHLAKKFRHLYPERLALFSDALLAETIVAGLRRAQGYGLTDEDDVALFVLLVVVVGWYFDSYRPFRYILYSPSLSLSKESRLDLLTTLAKQADWQASSDTSAMRLRNQQALK